MTLPRSSDRLQRRLFIAALVGLSTLLALDHLLWSLVTTAPITRGDSPRHARWAVESFLRTENANGWLHLGLIYKPDYYPRLVSWLAIQAMRCFGPSGHVMRATLALFTGLMALGTGWMAARSWGRLAGLTAAALTGVIPLLWTLRAEVMLDMPLAAMSALFLASLPVDRRGGQLPRALGCGLVLAAAMLTKQTMPWLALPALGLAGIRAAWRLPVGWRWRVVGLAAATAMGAGAAALFLEGYSGSAVALAVLGAGGMALWAHTRRWPHLRDLCVVVLVGVLVAGPWYARSAEPILTGLARVESSHPGVPSGLAGLVRIFGMTEYLSHHLLPAPVALLVLLGLIAIPVAGRRRPLVLPVLGSLVGGFALISSFSDLHGRHYAPLVPMLLYVSVAPLGVLARWRWTRPAAALLMVGAVLWAGTLAASWQLELDGPRQLRVQRQDADIPRWMPAMAPRLVVRRLTAPTWKLRLLAPDPRAVRLPVGDALDTLARHRQRSGASGPAHLLSVDISMEEDGLVLALHEAGLRGVSVLNRPDPRRLEQLLDHSPVYALELLTTEDGRRHRHRRRPDPVLGRLGFQEIASFDARLRDGSGPLRLVLLHAPPATN